MHNTSTYLILTDIHDNTGNFTYIPELEAISGIIISGDLTFAGGPKEASKVLHVIESLGKPVYAVPGNMDTPDVADWLNARKQSIHRSIIELPSDLLLVGLGFSPLTPFNTPGEYPDEELGLWLEEIMQSHPLSCQIQGENAHPWVLVSHTPPFNTLCDRLSNGVPVGSKAIRDFIVKYQPDLCICGHIHESAAIDTLGKTTLINSGPLGEGRYGLLHLPLDEQNQYIHADHNANLRVELKHIP